MNQKITNELLKIKKVRLVENNVHFEELALMNNFSDDEITYELSKLIQKEAKNKKTLRKTRMLEQELKSLKRYSIESMKIIINTMKSIDENSKRIVFKHFD